MKTWNERHFASLRRRAKKVKADPVLVEKFLGLAEAKDALLHTVRGNRNRWKRAGCLAHWTESNPEKTRFIEWELTVRTTWKGADYTVTTRIEETTHVAGADRAHRVYDSSATETLWKPYTAEAAK